MNLAQLHPTLRLRIGVLFTQRLVDSMVMTFMAIYLAGRFGIAAAGGLSVVAMVIAAIGTLCGGHVADSWGRRPVLLIGEASACAGFVLMAISHGAGMAGADLTLVAAYAVNRFGAGFAAPANEAMIVDISTAENRTLVYTANYWSVNLALAVGSLIGAFLYRGHFSALLAGGAVAMAAILLTTARWVGESKPPADGAAAASAPAEGWRGYGHVLRDRLFARYVLAVTLLMTIELQIINWIGVRLSVDVAPQQLLAIGSWSVHVDGVRVLGMVRTENTVLVVAMAFVIHRVLRGVPRRVRMQGGLVLLVAGYVALALSSTPWVLLAAGLVFTVGELMDAPVRQALLAELVPTAARTRYMAVYSLHIRVALIAAALGITLGAILPRGGMAVFYVLVGAAVLVQYRALLAARPEPAPADAPIDAPIDVPADAPVADDRVDA